MGKNQSVRSFVILSAVASVALSACSHTEAATIVFAPTATTAAGQASFDIATNYTPNSTPTNASGSAGEVTVFTGTPMIPGGDGTPITSVSHTNTSINPRIIQFDNSGGSAAAFTFSGSQINLYNSINVQSGVTTDQTFGLLISLRTSTTTFTNNGSGVLSFSTINQNSSNTTGNPVSAVFTGTVGGNIQVGSLNNSGGSAGTGTTVGLVKNGLNQLLFNSTTAVSTYSGPTTINAGTLALAAGASISNTATTTGNSSAVTVNAGTTATAVAGGTLAGSGNVAHPVILANTGGTATGFAEGATLAPGVAGVNNGTGTLTLSSTTAFTVGSFSKLNFDLTATPQAGNVIANDPNDLIALGTGAGPTPVFSGLTQININALATLGVGTYSLIDGYAGTIDSGTPGAGFNGMSLVVAGDTSGNKFALANNAGELDLVVTGPASVPEPASASIAVFAIGAGLLRRRRNAAR